MKVLLINGSPEKEGCSARALKEVASSLEQEGVETEIFWIGNKAIGGCTACHYCHTHEGCVIDDVVNKVGKLAASADGFVFASPVYYASMAGNMKAFMDRLFYANGKYLRGKPAASVISSRRAGSTAVWDEFNKYFGIDQMPIVTSCYWNEVHGNTPFDVEKDEEGMISLRILGENMAYLLACLELGKKAGLVNKGASEKPVHTNFIH